MPRHNIPVRIATFKLVNVFSQPSPHKWAFCTPDSARLALQPRYCSPKYVVLSGANGEPWSLPFWASHVSAPKDVPVSSV